MGKINFKKIAIYAINAFYDGTYANFSKHDFMKCGIGENTIIKVLKELCEDGEIEKCTKNGFYPRYKISNPMKCPEFIFNKGLTISDKLLILKCKELGIHEEIPTRELANILNISHSNLYTPLKRILSTGKSLFEYIIDDSIIDLSKPNLDEVIVKEFGWQYKGKPSTAKLEKSIENFLLKKSWNRFKDSAKITDYDLTEKYIKEILEKQEYKDYYTGIIPDNYKEYSIDRIDSSKGYIKGNIVITTNTINVMKGDLTTEEFKSQINLLYNNISNF